MALMIDIANSRAENHRTLFAPAGSTIEGLEVAPERIPVFLKDTMDALDNGSSVDAKKSFSKFIALYLMYYKQKAESLPRTAVRLACSKNNADAILMFPYLDYASDEIRIKMGDEDVTSTPYEDNDWIDRLVNPFVRKHFGIWEHYTSQDDGHKNLRGLAEALKKAIETQEMQAAILYKLVNDEIIRRNAPNNTVTDAERIFVRSKIDAVMARLQEPDGQITNKKLGKIFAKPSKKERALSKTNGQPITTMRIGTELNDENWFIIEPIID